MASAGSRIEVPFSLQDRLAREPRLLEADDVQAEGLPLTHKGVDAASRIPGINLPLLGRCRGAPEQPLGVVGAEHKQCRLPPPLKLKGYVFTLGFGDEDPRIVAEIVAFFNSPDRLNDLRASERVAQVCPMLQFGKRSSSFKSVSV